MFLSSAFGPRALGRPVAAGRVGLGPREDSGARSGRPHTRTAARAPRGRWRQPRSPTREPLAPRDAGGGASAAAMFPHAGPLKLQVGAAGPASLLALAAGARATGGWAPCAERPREASGPASGEPGERARGRPSLPVRGGVGQAAGRTSRRLGAGPTAVRVQQVHRPGRVTGCVWLPWLPGQETLAVRTHSVPHWRVLSPVTERLHGHCCPATIAHDDTGLGSFCGEGQHLPE